MSRDTNDPRDEMISITMRGEAWDFIRASGGYKDYMSPAVREEAEAALEAIRQGHGQRRKMAVAEHRLRVAAMRLTDERKTGVRAAVRNLLDQMIAGTLKVDHLGHPAIEVDGWAVRLIPAIHGGGSAINIAMPQIYFENDVAGISDDERIWLLSMIAEESGQQDPHHWNDVGPWFSVVVGPTYKKKS